MPLDKIKLSIYLFPLLDLVFIAKYSLPEKKKPKERKLAEPNFVSIHSGTMLIGSGSSPLNKNPFYLLFKVFLTYLGSQHFCPQVELI